MKEVYGGKCDKCEKWVDKLHICEICGAQVCKDCIENGVCVDCQELNSVLAVDFKAEDIE